MTRREAQLEPLITIPVSFVRGMLSGVSARGESIDIYLQDAGIPLARLEQIDARVTVDQYLSLFRALTLRRNDAMLGFLSRPFRRGSIGMIVRAGVSAPELNTAMRRIARAFNLLQDDLVIQPCRQHGKSGVSIRFHEPQRQWPNFLHELLLRVFWRLMAWLAGDRLRAAGFDFAYPLPAYAADYAQLFPAPLRFDCARSAFWIESKRLEAPVRQLESSVPEFLTESQAYVVYRKSIQETTATQLRSLLQKHQPDWPDLARCAQEMHMSAATLQRRLAAEKSTFQGIKDALRRDLAIQQLHTRRVSLEVLASELGFSSRDSFQHAFKKWTGSAPGEYRMRD